MERIYKGRYFDGQQSSAIVVNVQIGQNQLTITYTDNNHELVTIQWPKEAIQQVSLAANHIALKYVSGYPYQQLEISDTDGITAYQQWKGGSMMQGILQKRSMAGVLLLLGGIFGSMAAFYFWGVPWLADRIAQQIPVSYETELGKSIASELLTSEKVDSTKSIAINRFFKHLQLKTDYPVQITVVNSATVNAFALPGGQIIVYDSILATMQSPEELAALLYHEFGHVELKHATRNIFRSLSGYLFISALFGDLSGVSALVISNAQELRNLSYSRELESEADAFALQQLRSQKIDANGMIRLFESLQKAEKMEVAEWMSTHPDLDQRIASVKQYQQKNRYVPQPNDSLHYYFNKLTEINEWQ